MTHLEILMTISMIIGICNCQISFLKTMEGEKFRENLVPSLKTSVSYILASYSGNRTIYYSIKSKYFTVDKLNGNVYLISKFDKNELSIFTTHTFQITAYDGQSTVSATNTITIMDANDNAPSFVSIERVFEVEEVTAYPADLTFKNGSTVFIRLRDIDPSNVYITVTCGTLCSCNDICKKFQFVKRSDLSTNQDWVGTIRLMSEINYIERSFYQLIAVAKDDADNTMNVTLIIKVLPSLNKAPELSSSCSIFDIDENKPIASLVGQLKLIEGYELLFNSVTVYSLVQNVQELLSNQIIGNDPDATQSTIDLANKYFQILNRNELRTKQIIDRDSYEVTLNSGIIKVWIKISYLNKNSFTYEKLMIIINDLNDNVPKFGQYVLNSVPDFTLIPVNNPLTTLINENEIGPLFFNNLGNNILITYDLDLGENATFILKVDSSVELTVLEINKYFVLGTSSLQSNFVEYIQSVSNFNLIGAMPIDFESLGVIATANFASPGVSAKGIKFNVIAKETASKEKLQSESLQLIIYVQDVNDNKPIFEQESYQLNLDENAGNGVSDLEILSFKVTDRDSGVYGLDGLYCYLRGEGAEKFRVDSLKQKLYLSACASPPCLNYAIRSRYDLVLICTDNNGKGFSTYSTVTIIVKNIIQRGFKMLNKLFYLLATGTNKIEIPTLKFKPIVYNPANRISYTVTDLYLAQLFSVDSFGVFRILASSLSLNQSTYGNGTFRIPISMTDLYGYTEQITVILQLSLIQTYNRCPKISSSARCTFNFNDFFDKDFVRFCFYNASPVATDEDTFTNDPRIQQIIFSLSSDSPYFLDINSFDGCVKISPTYRLEYNQVEIIRYSVGVMNPGFPECLSSSLVDCNIVIRKVKDKPPRCDSPLIISDNQSQRRVVAYGSNSNSVLNYKIVSEETFYLDGRVITNTDPTQFYYSVDINTGILSLLRQDIFNQDIISVSATVTVTDVSVVPQLSVNCMTVFRFIVVKNPLIFIGSSYRSIDLCEDVPVYSPVLSLAAFDSSFSSNSICFSILNNDYFNLINGNNTSNGTVILMNNLDYEYFTVRNLNPIVNFTSKAYFCNDPINYIQQTVLVKVLNVNKFAPRLDYPYVPLKLSLNSSKNFVTDPIRVYDYDAYPFNQFQCNVQNDNLFSVIKTQDSIAISYVGAYQQYTEFVDLAIRCCDDFSSIGSYDLSCSSISKCSMTPIRIQFTNYVIPVYCANNYQIAYVAENVSPASDISSILCVSNNTKRAINYEILGISNYFKIDPTSGTIKLIQSLMNSGLSSQQLSVKCSNGLASDTCSININVISVNDTRPVWVIPDINSNCVIIEEDTPLRTPIITVRAVIKGSTQTYDNIKYYFVSNNAFVNSIYEFEFRNNTTGEILLRQNLNRNISKFRELTLAASLESLQYPNQPIISYQYLCINITTAKSFQPCFRTYSNRTSVSYKIYLDNNDNNNCFFSQQIKAYNVDADELGSYYYYIVGATNNVNSDLLSYLTVDNTNGRVCATTGINTIVDAIAANQNDNYYDELGSLCYNLAILVSKIKDLTVNDLKKVVYDRYNCSFSTLTVCFGKNLRNITSPSILNAECKTIVSLTSLSASQSTCLSRFQVDYSTLATANTFLSTDNNAFKVDNDTNCLHIDRISSIKSLSCGFLPLNVTLNNYVYTNNNIYVYIYDWIVCSIYVTKKCEQEFYVVTKNNARFVLDNSYYIVNTLSNVFSNLYRRNIIALIHKVHNAPNLYYNDDTFQTTDTLILMSFYDEAYCRFLEGDEVLTIVNPSLASFSQINALLITQLFSSCVPSRNISVGDIIAIIVLWAIFLFLMLLLLACLTCALCFMFKKLKYKNDRIVLQEQVIPILTPASPVLHVAPVGVAGVSAPPSPVLLAASTPQNYPAPQVRAVPTAAAPPAMVQAPQMQATPPSYAPPSPPQIRLPPPPPPPPQPSSQLVTLAQPKVTIRESIQPIYTVSPKSRRKEVVNLVPYESAYRYVGGTEQVIEEIVEEIPRRVVYRAVDAAEPYTRVVTTDVAGGYAAGTRNEGYMYGTTNAGQQIIGFEERIVNNTIAEYDGIPVQGYEVTGGGRGYEAYHTNRRANNTGAFETTLLRSDQVLIDPRFPLEPVPQTETYEINTNDVIYEETKQLRR